MQRVSKSEVVSYWWKKEFPEDLLMFGIPATMCGIVALTSTFLKHVAPETPVMFFFSFAILTLVMGMVIRIRGRKILARWERWRPWYQALKSWARNSERSIRDFPVTEEERKANVAWAIDRLYTLAAALGRTGSRWRRARLEVRYMETWYLLTDTRRAESAGILRGSDWIDPVIFLKGVRSGKKKESWVSL